MKKWREQRKPEVDALIERLDAFMGDIGQPNPVADCLSSWKSFLSAKIDDTEAISHLLNALDTSFGYTCYAQQEAKATELDDLATRKKTRERADAFCRHDQKIRAAHRYAQLQVNKDGPVEAVVGEFRAFLETAVDGDGKGQSTILEIK